MPSKPPSPDDTTSLSVEVKTIVPDVGFSLEIFPSLSVNQIWSSGPQSISQTCWRFCFTILVVISVAVVPFVFFLLQLTDSRNKKNKKRKLLFRIKSFWSKYRKSSAGLIDLDKMIQLLYEIRNSLKHKDFTSTGMVWRSLVYFFLLRLLKHEVTVIVYRQRRRKKLLNRVTPLL